MAVNFFDTGPPYRIMLLQSLIFFLKIFFVAGKLLYLFCGALWVVWVGCFLPEE